jgi:predicted  nucleic acid-binding Zn-ribbon protein
MTLYPPLIHQSHHINVYQAAAEARAVAFEAQVEAQQREFETARQTLTQQNQEALDAAAARRMQMEEQATEKLNKEIGIWEKRSEEKEATITDLRAQLNAMTESDYRKKQDIIKLREQVQALERDIRQNSEAALRQQSEQLKVNFRVKRQLVESRSTAHRCVQELFQRACFLPVSSIPTIVLK